MPRNKRGARKEERDTPAPRPFWSGMITFGLVSLPVSLYVAARATRVSLRMVAPDGEPLRRRYFCPKSEQPLERDEIVRGYEVERDRYVVVEEEELDAIAPRKSQEIDLRRFVPEQDIDPMYFERAYFLAPEEGATKPYRLLAKSMKETGRAGIATCVIRGSEYLVAILSSRGILRAEILRFEEELRSPGDVGLSEPGEADSEMVRGMERAIESGARKSVDRDALADTCARRLRERVDEKLAAGADVFHPREAEEPEEAADQGEPADLMALLKRSLRQEGNGRGAVRKAQDLTREELYRRAQELEIPGRSKMTKAELAAAVNAA